MTVYLVEAYLSRSRAGELAALGKRLRKAAQGQPVGYLRTTYVPDDDTCFHYVEAPTAAAVESFVELAQVSFDRILEAQNVTVPTASNAKEES